MLRRLGYRFVLKNGTFQINGTSLLLSLNIENTGFARLVLLRNATLVLRNISNNSLYTFKLNTDPRTWEGQITVSELIDVSSIPNGNYAAYLKLADANTALAARPEYNIRFANSNVWDSQYGYNNLNYTFNISGDVHSGLINIAEKELIVYPNPANNTIYINHTFKGSYINIYSIDGMLVKSIIPAEMSQEKCQLDISELTSGIYILSYNTTQGNKITRFIKY